MHKEHIGMHNKIDKKPEPSRLELTRNENFINGDLDIFDLLLSSADQPSYKRVDRKKSAHANL